MTARLMRDLVMERFSDGCRRILLVRFSFKKRRTRPHLGFSYYPTEQSCLRLPSLSLPVSGKDVNLFLVLGKIPAVHGDSIR